MRVGDTDGYQVALEWVITFDMAPSAGQWGRNVWKNSWNSHDFAVNKDGTVTICRPKDDTDLRSDFASGNKLYMYDMPGSPIVSAKYIFEVWARSTSGKKALSKWYYVDTYSGEFYEIAPGVTPKPKPWKPEGPPMLSTEQLIPFG